MREEGIYLYTHELLPHMQYLCLYFHLNGVSVLRPIRNVTTVIEVSMRERVRIGPHRFEASSFSVSP